MATVIRAAVVTLLLLLTATSSHAAELWHMTLDDGWYTYRCDGTNQSFWAQSARRNSLYVQRIDLVVVGDLPPGSRADAWVMTDENWGGAHEGYRLLIHAHMWPVHGGVLHRTQSYAPHPIRWDALADPWYLVAVNCTGGGVVGLEVELWYTVGTP